MWNKDLKLIAIEKETGKRFEVDLISFPLGKVSGKDIAIIIPCEDDSEVCEWRSIDEVDIEVMNPPT